MPIESEAEKADAETLRNWIVDRKTNAFEYLRQFVNVDSQMLKVSGYQTKEQAFTRIMTRAMDEIEKRIRAHERKYPHNEGEE